MNASPSPSEQNDPGCQSPRSRDHYHAPERRKWCLRLNPLGATVIAAFGLALVFGLDNNWFGFHVKALPSLGPAEAVDINVLLATLQGLNLVK